MALPSSASGLDHLHALLRARKLDRTLTSMSPSPAASAAPFQMAVLDQRVAGGLPRGHLSEIVGPASSGRTSLAWAALAAATARGEWAALVDTFDRFDPLSAAAAGIALPQLLWVRGQALSRTAGGLDPAWVPGVRSVSGPGTLLERTVDRAIKALNLVVQSGVCTMVVIDLIDVSAQGLARVPRSTWLRIQRVVEGSETAVVLLAAMPVARSAGGLSIVLGAGGRDSGVASGGSGVERPLGGAPAPGAGCEPRSRATEVRWKGTHDRSRRLGGLTTRLRTTSPRGLVGELPLVVG